MTSGVFYKQKLKKGLSAVSIAARNYVFLDFVFNFVLHLPA